MTATEQLSNNVKQDVTMLAAEVDRLCKRVEKLEGARGEAAGDEERAVEPWLVKLSRDLITRALRKEFDSWMQRHGGKPHDAVQEMIDGMTDAIIREQDWLAAQVLRDHARQEPRS